jgi:hypothetical protein
VDEIGNSACRGGNPYSDTQALSRTFVVFLEPATTTRTTTTYTTTTRTTTPTTTTIPSDCKDCTQGCSNYKNLGTLSKGKELTSETCYLDSSSPRDSFYFYASESGKVTISVDGPDPCDFDIYSGCIGCGYSATCTNVTSSCDETCTFTASSGIYYQFYVKVYSGSGKARIKVSMEQPVTTTITTTTTPTTTVTTTTSTTTTTIPTGCVNCAHAKPISSGQSLSTCSLNRGQNRPYDFFKFDAGANGFIVVRMDNIAGSGSEVDLDLVVHSTCTDSPFENVECMSVFPGSDTCLVKVSSGTSYKIRIWDCQDCPGTDKTARLTVNFYENLNSFNCDNSLQTGLMLLRASKYVVNRGERFTLSVLTTPNCNGKTVLFLSEEAGRVVGSCTLNSNGECSIPIDFTCNEQACLFVAILDLDGDGDVDENEPVSNRIIVLVSGGVTTTSTTTPLTTTTTTTLTPTTTRPTITTTTIPTPSTTTLTPTTTKPTTPLTTLTPPTTTPPSTTTTLQPTPIKCEECFSNSKCKCTLTATCDNGAWILQNKEGKPLDASITSPIPPTTIEFETKQPGKISVRAICFKDTTPDSYGPYILEVKEPFLDCDKECEVLKPCECRVKGCNEGYFQAIMGTTLISREKINKASYSTSFISEKTGVVDVSVTCSNPARYAEAQIPISGISPGKKFSASNFNSKEIDGKYKITLDFTNNLGENVIIVFTVSKEGSAASKTFTATPGSGTASTIFECKDLGAGSFQVSWKAFKSSDKKNPIAWSKLEEMVSVEC